MSTLTAAILKSNLLVFWSLTYCSNPKSTTVSVTAQISRNLEQLVLQMLSIFILDSVTIKLSGGKKPPHPHQPSLFRPLQRETV